MIYQLITHVNTMDECIIHEQNSQEQQLNTHRLVALLFINTLQFEQMWILNKIDSYPPFRVATYHP